MDMAFEFLDSVIVIYYRYRRAAEKGMKERYSRHVLGPGYFAVGARPNKWKAPSHGNLINKILTFITFVCNDGLGCEARLQCRGLRYLIAQAAYQNELQWIALCIHGQMNFVENPPQLGLRVVDVLLESLGIPFGLAL